MHKSLFPLVAVAALTVSGLWTQQASAQRVIVRTGYGYPAYSYPAYSYSAPVYSYGYAPVYSYNTAYVPAYTYDYGYAPAYGYRSGYGYYQPSGVYVNTGRWGTGVGVNVGGIGFNYSNFNRGGYYGGYRGGYRGGRGWR